MSQSQIVGSDLLIEFLEVVFHSILYYRKLYPEEIFVKKKIYGTLVNISKHPELNEYIKQVLLRLKELIELDGKNIKSINLLINNHENNPIEKYVFQLEEFQNRSHEVDPYFMKTEESLRTACLKLSMAESYLKPLPSNSSFTINIITNHAAHVTCTENSKDQDFPWIVDEEFNDIIDGQLLPIKDVKSDCLNLQFYVVEDKNLKLE